MSNVIKINDISVQVVEHQCQRVVTLAMMDQVHGRPEGTARKRFSDNKERLVEGRHYFKQSASEIRTRFPGLIAERATEDVTLLTERGYLVLVKSFTDDLAWQVQEQLVDGYFRAGSPKGEPFNLNTLPPAVASQVGGIVKAVVHKELAAMIPELIQAELSKNQTSLRHGETAGQIWKRHGLPPLKNASRMLSGWLVKRGAYTDGHAEVGGVKSKMFDPDLADKAMREGVKELCWRYVVERQGQMLIEFNHTSLKPVPGEAIPLAMGRRLRKQRASNRGKDAA